jgi:hypothetical protein
MKTINMIANAIQEFLGVFSNIAVGLNEGSLIFKDTMEQARKQQLQEFKAQLNAVAD